MMFNCFPRPTKTSWTGNWAEGELRNWKYEERGMAPVDFPRWIQSIFIQSGDYRLYNHRRPTPTPQIKQSLPWWHPYPENLNPRVFRFLHSWFPRMYLGRIWYPGHNRSTWHHGAERGLHHLSGTLLVLSAHPHRLETDQQRGEAAPWSHTDTFPGEPVASSYWCHFSVFHEGESVYSSHRAGSN